MKIKPLTFRKTSQIVFFLLFTLTVFQATYPFKPWLPPELFLWLDPLTALTTQIAGHFFDIVFLLALIIFLSPLVFGRAFCGWICPLGTVIDGCDHVISPKKPKDYRRLRPIKLIILSAVIILAICGVQYAWLFDPLPILWRSMGVIGMAFLFLLVDTTLNGIVTIGIFPNTMLNIQDKLSGYLFPVANPDFGGLIAPLIIFLIILGLSRLSRRFWCRYLCPLGALLGLVARFSPLRRIVDVDKCTSCGICKHKCKTDAIEPDFLATAKSECILCLNCQRDCPTGAITYGRRSPRQMANRIDLSRRAFIGTGITALAGAGLLKIDKIDPHRTDRLIRPPGALTEDDFLERCIRCGECVRICATSGTCLPISVLETGLEGLLTPLAKFRRGYCEINCNLCGQICPTKAIQPLSVPEKKKTKMGQAIFLKDRCIPYRLYENCIVCEEHCPTPDKAIKVLPSEYIDPVTGQKRTVNYPYIDESLCIGCGICENKCPLNGEAGVIVVREGEERLQA
ncbi:MAG: 4Fe-4S binding protein [bacterium]